MTPATTVGTTERATAVHSVLPVSWYTRLPAYQPGTIGAKSEQQTSSSYPPKSTTNKSMRTRTLQLSTNFHQPSSATHTTSVSTGWTSISNQPSSSSSSTDATTDRTGWTNKNPTTRKKKTASIIKLSHLSQAFTQLNAKKSLNMTSVFSSVTAPQPSSVTAPQPFSVTAPQSQPPILPLTKSKSSRKVPYKTGNITGRVSSSTSRYRFPNGTTTKTEHTTKLQMSSFYSTSNYNMTTLKKLVTPSKLYKPFNIRTFPLSPTIAHQLPSTYVTMKPSTTTQLDLSYTSQTNQEQSTSATTTSNSEATVSWVETSTDWAADSTDSSSTDSSNLGGHQGIPVGSKKTYELCCS